MNLLNRNRERAARVDAIVTEAKRHVGYRSRPDRQSAFQIQGLGGKPWNGTFVDRVLHDAIGSPFAEVRFLSTVTALSYYVKRNGVYQKPKVGDVVFYNFASDPARWEEQPHVGIVTEVKPNGVFLAIEGETAPGTPQGSQLVDGVFERTRHVTDTIGFVRPVGQTVLSTDEPSKIKESYFTSNPKTKARAVETVQRALNRATGKVFNRGKWDTETKSAVGVYAREHGEVANRGEITNRTLTLLSDFTGEFEVE